MPLILNLFRFFAVFAFLPAAFAADPLEVKLGYLHLDQPAPPVLSNVIPEPEDAGQKGAELGLSDNNSTGRFLGHAYSLLMASSDDIEVLIEQAKQWHQDDGVHFFVVDLPESALRRFASELVTIDSLIFNIGSRANNLRAKDCLQNVLHTRPSDAMLTDALGQWFVARKQKKWFLISGTRAADTAFSNSLKRTARRYGIEIVEEKLWNFDSDLRRTAQKEMPIFTKHKEYDAVVVADVAGDFGENVLHNTWLPRPVAGTQGLTPVTWHRVVEQWGAAQLQSRFEKLSGRWMNSLDYAAWIAVRSVGEAVTKTGVAEFSDVAEYMISDKFELAGFKGRKLSYRQNGQLRQPIPLIHPRALVGQAPIEGFLHAGTDMDSLGLDKSESDCTLVIR